MGVQYWATTWRLWRLLISPLNRWTQFWALLWRAWIAVLKEPAVIRVNVGQTIVIGLMIGIVFLDQDYDQEGVLNINGAIFIMLTNVTFGYQFSVINVSRAGESFIVSFPTTVLSTYIL